MAPTLHGLAATLLAGVAALGGPNPSAGLPPTVVDAVTHQLINEEARDLGAARGLRPGRPLAVRVLNRALLTAERDALGASRRPAAEVRDEASLRWLMGLGGNPRRAASGTNSGREVTGLYDPAAKRVLVANWISLDEGRFGRWHDIALALLDQRFSLARFLGSEAPEPPLDRDSDAILARQALVEGDATVQALEHLSPDGPPPSRVLWGIVEGTRGAITHESSPGEPLDLARRLFVQLDGTTFVAALRARAPWAAVNDAWARPPESTEQILHPEKFERREGPDDLGGRLPRELPGGWRATLRDTLGELGTRVFLERVVGEHRAARAAAGWSGDRVGLYRAAGPDDDQTAPALVVWISTWDDVTDADDFAEQAAAVVGGLAGTPLDEASPGATAKRAKGRSPRRWRQTDARGRVFLLEQRGKSVAMMLDAPPELEHAWPALVAGVARPTGPPLGARRQHAGRRR